MKPTTGSPRPRRSVAPKPRKKVRLDLKRRSEPQPAPDADIEKKNNFWKWVAVVALLHLLVIGIVCFIYEMTPAPKPPEQFISLLPQGDVVKGTTGAQEAHKLGPTTAAPTVHHHTSSTPPAPVKPPTPVTPPKPKLLVPPPMIEPPPTPSTSVLDKPKPTPPPPKPTPPKPKVKVDLTLADAPDADKPVTKPKTHPKKPVDKPSEDKDDSPDHPDSAGLSKEQIAAKLGEKLDAAGVKDATHTGTSGSTNTRENAFKDFYLEIAQQVMDQWRNPSAVGEVPATPVGVHIYVEKDGQIRPGSVYLTRSCGNSVYDDSAIATVNSLGSLHEPLPEGCPPDISINVKPAQ